MPLHLLGKKSWNVYNAENVARVRRDEADARAREEAAEQRMQEADAARRLAILRGEEPPPLPEPEPEPEPEAYSSRDRNRDPLEGLGGSGSGSGGKERRKRKRPGEDDTDFEMRVVRERAAAGDKAREELSRGQGPAQSPGKATDVAIVDSAGHIDLFGGQAAASASASASAAKGEKNPEYEREAAKKRREQEDQYTMRFANAAGRDGGLARGAAPWYIKPGDGKAKEEEAEFDAPTKDVWGNEDPARKARSAARLDANDPLAMMKSGARKVREVEKERKRGAEERERELKDLRREEKRREKRRRREGRSDGVDIGELDGFNLDAPPRPAVEKERERDRSSERKHSKNKALFHDR
ncbi:putative homocitrate synthase protein [Phaeoacremonium minimum UCRPA7]|uniref:Putative homocitrate synthase protein n=1 Tax=Phaeoacremonium minimum (strain UCR-PA7) TaxID=1286976 RepID=R8BWB8_PHAM7|nr:putative homocitrate synthase protein [Phaeoacremonium minimum UCRPA7]EOO03638.1 putative homocitrate synthase protein [Phaeoacremonium minimum UCRPA7]